MIPIIKKYGLIPIFLCTLLGFIFVFSSIFFTYYSGSTTDQNTVGQIITTSCSSRTDYSICTSNQAFTIICIITSIIALFIMLKYLLSIWVNPVESHNLINSRFNSGYSVVICIFCLLIAAVSQIIAFSMQIISKEQSDPLDNSEYGPAFILSAQGFVLYSLGLISLLAYLFIHFIHQDDLA